MTYARFILVKEFDILAKDSPETHRAEFSTQVRSSACIEEILKANHHC